MKKMFLAAITALALCSYSYAQDDYEDEYEEDAPAREEAAGGEPQRLLRQGHEVAWRLLRRRRSLRRGA